MALLRVYCVNSSSAVLSMLNLTAEMRYLKMHGTRNLVK